MSRFDLIFQIRIMNILFAAVCMWGCGPSAEQQKRDFHGIIWNAYAIDPYEIAEDVQEIAFSMQYTGNIDLVTSPLLAEQVSWTGGDEESLASNFPFAFTAICTDAASWHFSSPNKRRAVVMIICDYSERRFISFDNYGEFSFSSPSDVALVLGGATQHVPADFELISENHLLYRLKNP